eukprot:gene14806-biopygen3620
MAPPEWCGRKFSPQPAGAIIGPSSQRRYTKQGGNTQPRPWGNRACPRHAHAMPAPPSCSPKPRKRQAPPTRMQGSRAWKTATTFDVSSNRRELLQIWSGRCKHVPSWWMGHHSYGQPLGETTLPLSGPCPFPQGHAPLTECLPGCSRWFGASLRIGLGFRRVACVRTASAVISPRGSSAASALPDPGSRADTCNLSGPKWDTQSQEGGGLSPSLRDRSPTLRSD